MTAVQVIKDSNIPDFCRKTRYSAGYDLYNNDGYFDLKPMEKKLVHTGIKVNMMQCDSGTCALVLPRSGVSLKTNLRICNSPGLIDQDYQGEICIILQNIGNTVENVLSLERIAQLVFIKSSLSSQDTDVTFVDDFKYSTERGENGFGFTGK